MLGIALVLLALVTACQAAGGAGSDAWTGFLEGTNIDVSAEVGGRIAEIAPNEGDAVQPGQVLLKLDDEFARLRIDIADASVAAAQAQLALLEAGARPEDLRRAQARVDQATAGLVAASQTVSDTEAIRANPQTLLIVKADAEARVLAATQQLTATVKQAQAADLESHFWEDQTRSLWEGTDITLPGGRTLHFDTPANRLTFAQNEWHKSGTNAWQAWAAVEVATANARTADAALKDITDQLANPIALDARVNQARAARERAAANLQAAQAAVRVLREGASPAQIQSARDALDQARAARATLDQELERYTLRAPRAGTVTRVAYRVGEVAAPTVPLVSLSVDGELTLRVFVPMSQLERMRVGEAARVVVPELGNRTVSGTVTHIADRAEFTGRQAQTDSERNAQLVAVEIAIKNADGQVAELATSSELKAGMPASVTFGELPSASEAAAAIVTRANSLTFSGSLEAKQTRIAAELGGRVIAVRVNRGDEVKPGDVLIGLDDAAIKTSLAEAAAAARAAQSNLDQVKEPARPGTIALTEAAVDLAAADLQAAKAALESANRTLATPQELLSQVHLWEGKVLAAQGDVARAEAALSEVKSQADSAASDLSTSGKTRFAMLQKQQQAAEANLVAAQSTQKGNQRVLDLYRQMLNQPLELLAAQHAAENQVRVAEAGLKVAEAEREIVRRDPLKEAVALAEARLRAAEANQKMVQAQLKRYSITSPIGGTVVGRDVEPGEAVRAGTPLLTLADSRELEMTVYVPIRNISAVKVGQAASVKLPSLPGKTWTAKVTYIAPEAEFKPANIYNSTERSEMVFAVRVTVPNPNGDLKAGLPADVTFVGQ